MHRNYFRITTALCHLTTVLCLLIEQIAPSAVVYLKIFAMIGFINTSLNPFIYAARYEVFKRTLKQMINKDTQICQGTATH